MAVKLRRKLGRTLRSARIHLTQGLKRFPTSRLVLLMRFGGGGGDDGNRLACAFTVSASST